MRLLKNRSIGFYLCFVLLLTLATAGSAIVHADSGPNTATINAGGLGESSPSNKVSLNLDGTVRLVNYTFPITVIDARGSGGGWNVTITSTQFRLHDGKDHDQGKERLSAKASSIIGVNVSCAPNSTCTNPMNSVSYPLLVPAGKIPPPPVKFFNAAAGSGLGEFLLSMMVQVKVPAKVEPGTFTSTIIVTIANGP